MTGGAWRNEHTILSLLDLLPDISRASALSDIYFQQVSQNNSPVNV
jgi:hypothetical protein